MSRFKLVRIMIGSGWPSGHIAVDEHWTYPGKAGGNELCLTHDAQDAHELSLNIDELIAELESIREEAPQKFTQWTAEYKADQLRRHQKRP